MPGTRKLWVCLVVGFKYCFLYLNTENGGPGWWVVCLALVFFNCIQILCLFYLKFIYLRTPFWCFQPNSNKWPVLKIMPQLSCIKLFIFSLSPQQYFLSLPLPQQIWELYHDDGAGSGLRPLPASMLAFLMGFGVQVSGLCPQACWHSWWGSGLTVFSSGAIGNQDRGSWRSYWGPGSSRSSPWSLLFFFSFFSCRSCDCWLLGVIWWVCGGFEVDFCSISIGCYGRESRRHWWQQGVGHGAAGLTVRALCGLWWLFVVFGCW